ncbi:MAG: M10 family metallopeptidase C-terminal domain-containing protein [Rhodospirillaceae bacterium]|nr:M10 family metallopeptidase C-terminal domain-containing protein [Rhodospirillales bacterium]
MSTPTTNSVGDTYVSASGQESYIQALIEGDKWGGALGTGVSLTYSFPLAGASYDTYYYSSMGEWTNWSPAETSVQTNVAAALAAWASVANLTFTQVADNASVVGDIRVAYSAAVDTENAAAWAYYPSDYPVGGDVWLSPQAFTGRSSAPGSYNYFTLIHEIGHALGLSHSFGGSIDGVTLPLWSDNFSHSIMSYWTTSENPGAGATQYCTTPMLYDIAAIQYLYGANTSYHTGDDTYTFDSSSTYWQTIWDAGGNDTIKVTGFHGSTIDLRAGQFSRIGAPVRNGDPYGVEEYDPITDTVAIAFGTTIENATAGGGNDILIGNDVANTLSGGFGNDTISGGAGNDTLIGGGGYDRMDGGAGDDVLIVTASGATLSEDVNGGTDTVQSAVTISLARNFENLTLTGFDAINGIGNKRDNVLVGNAYANILSGRDGNDTLIGGVGSDTLSGGEGVDLFYYESASQGSDRIMDFEGGADKIGFYSPNFGNLAAGTLASGSFVVNGAATQSLATFLFNSATHTLSFDSDGTGVLAAVNIATFGRHTTLSANDILINNGFS